MGKKGKGTGSFGKWAWASLVKHGAPGGGPPDERAPCGAADRRARAGRPLSPEGPGGHETHPRPAHTLSLLWSRDRPNTRRGHACGCLRARRAAVEREQAAAAAAGGGPPAAASLSRPSLPARLLTLSRPHLWSGPSHTAMASHPAGVESSKSRARRARGLCSPFPPDAIATSSPSLPLSRAPLTLSPVLSSSRPPLQVSATTRRTPCAAAAGASPSTSRSPSAARAATRRPGSANVSWRGRETEKWGPRWRGGRALPSGPRGDQAQALFVWGGGVWRERRAQEQARDRREVEPRAPLTTPSAHPRPSPLPSSPLFPQSTGPRSPCAARRPVPAACGT